MNGQIGRLHHRYQVINAPDSAHLLSARLDRVAHEYLADALADALQQTLGEDECVYVLRQINIQLSLVIGIDVPDAQVAQRWGAKLAGAVVRQLATTASDNAELVRFADQATYTTHFICDLLAGQAWQRWFYRPFLAHRAESAAATLRSVLLDANTQAHFPALLRSLYAAGVLDQLLTTLDAETLRRLWGSNPQALATATPAALRPLFAQALRLVDQLELWQSASPLAENLYHRYLATHPAAVDWRDRQGLAGGLYAILQFLADEGLLRWPEQPLNAAFLTRLDQMLDELDWLDTTWLRAAVIDLCAEPPHQLMKAAWRLPVRPIQHAPTPRQQALLTDLLAALAASQVLLEQAFPNSPANALRLYALLITHAPRWADDELATAVIQQILDAWAWLSKSLDQAATFHSLQRQDVNTALHTLPEQSRQRAASVLKAVTRLGMTALAVVETLTRAGQQPFSDQPVAHASAGNGQHPALQRLLGGLPASQRNQLLGALRALINLGKPGIGLLTLLASGELTLQLLEATQKHLALDIGPQTQSDPASLAIPLAERSGLDQASKAADKTPAHEQSTLLAVVELLQQLSQDERSQVSVALNAVTRLGATALAVVKTLSSASQQPFADHSDTSAAAGDDHHPAPQRLLAGLPAAQRNQLVDALKVLLHLGEPGVGLLTLLASGGLTLPILAAAQNRLAAARPSAAEQSTLLAVVELLQQLSQDERSQAYAALKPLADASEPGKALAQALVRGEVKPQALEPQRFTLETGVPTQCAGLFLLLRAIQDARLPQLVNTAYPQAEPVSPLAALLLALGLRWAGVSGMEGGVIDPGLSILAGLRDPVTFDQLRTYCSAISSVEHQAFQSTLLRLLAGQRLVCGAVLHLYRVVLDEDQTALIAGDETGSIWPLGRLVTDANIVQVAASWLEVWQSATGYLPKVVVTASWADMLTILPTWTIVPEPGTPVTDPDIDAALIAAHHTGHAALQAGLAALEHGRLDAQEADLTVALTAISLVRLWARWLRQFATSSTPYLLENFIRRPGRISLRLNTLVVELEPRALDVIIEMAGYLAELEKLSWLDDRNVRFRVSA